MKMQEALKKAIDKQGTVFCRPVNEVKGWGFAVKWTAMPNYGRNYKTAPQIFSCYDGHKFISAPAMRVGWILDEWETVTKEQIQKEALSETSPTTNRPLRGTL